MFIKQAVVVMSSFRFLPDSTVYLLNLGAMSLLWVGKRVKYEEVISSIGIIQADRYTSPVSRLIAKRRELKQRQEEAV
jgi:hypothetical protein